MYRIVSDSTSPLDCVGELAMQIQRRVDPAAQYWLWAVAGVCWYV